MWSCRGLGETIPHSQGRRGTARDEVRSKKLTYVEMTVAADPNPSAVTTRKGFGFA